MTTRSVITQSDADTLARYLCGLTMPFTVTVKPGKPRSPDQNRLQRLWCGEIAEQLGDRTTEEVRGECKARFGIPILCRDSPEFAEKYDAMLRPLPYATKMALLMEPFDFGVTRLMTTKQKTEYLDNMGRYWTERGIILTRPCLLYTSPSPRDS